jgi:ABC-type transport system substrate-binding protein
VRVLVPWRGQPAHGLDPPVLGLPELADRAWLATAGPAPSFGAQALSLWVPDGSPTGVRLAEFVQANLARAGCRVTLTVRPWAEFERAVSDGRADLFYLSWFADGPIPSRSSPRSWRADAGHGGNRAYYANAAVDSALAQARVAPTRERALALLREAEVTALSDAPLVPCSTA